MTEATCSDFSVGDVVSHVFHGRYATVTKVGRKYLTCELHVMGGQAPEYKWLPTSVRLVRSSADYSHTYDV